MTEKAKNIAVSVVSIAFGILLFLESYGIKGKMRHDMGSGFFPAVIAAAVVVVAIIHLILVLRDKGQNEVKGVGDVRGGLETIVLVLLYVAAFQPVGFIISTVLYLFLQIIVLTPAEKIRLPFISAFSFIFPFFIYVFFVYVINTPLPIGMFGF